MHCGETIANTGSVPANALASSPKQAATHLGLSALESVLSKKGYSPHSRLDGSPQISIEELTSEAQVLLPPGTSLPDPEWDDVAGELCAVSFKLSNFPF